MLWKPFNSRFLSFLCLLCVLWAQPLPAVDDVEVVTTIPVETTLGQEGTGKASEAWLEMVKGAQKTLDFAQFYLSKVMRIDDHISWVGTSNWAYSYFYKSRNVEVVIQNTAVAKTLDRLFNRLWNSSYTYPVEPKKEYTPPRIN